MSEESLKTYSPCCRNSVIQQTRDQRGRTEPPRVGAGPAGMGRLGSTNPACVLILKMRRPEAFARCPAGSSAEHTSVCLRSCSQEQALPPREERDLLVAFSASKQHAGTGAQSRPGCSVEQSHPLLCFQVPERIWRSRLGDGFPCNLGSLLLKESEVQEVLWRPQDATQGTSPGTQTSGPSVSCF